MKWYSGRCRSPARARRHSRKFFSVAPAEDSIACKSVMAVPVGRTDDEAPAPAQRFGGNTFAFARFFGRGVPRAVLCTGKIARERLPKQLADHLNKRGQKLFLGPASPRSSKVTWAVGRQPARSILRGKATSGTNRPLSSSHPPNDWHDRVQGLLRMDPRYLATYHRQGRRRAPDSLSEAKVHQILISHRYGTLDT